MTYLILLHHIQLLLYSFPYQSKISLFVYDTSKLIQFVCISNTKFTRAIVLHMENSLFVRLCARESANLYSAAMIPLGTKIMLVWL